MHIGGHANTPTLPVAPRLTRKTSPVGYWTPSTERDRERKVTVRKPSPEVVSYYYAMKNHTYM